MKIEGYKLLSKKYSYLNVGIEAGFSMLWHDPRSLANRGKKVYEDRLRILLEVF